MISTNIYKAIYLLPPLPTTLRGSQAIIDVDPANSSRIVYAHGKAIYMVNLEDPSKNEAYTEHSHTCTVAKFSPTGYYVASGDVTGCLRIWDATRSTHVLKAEYQVLSGPIKDISWDAEAKHLIVVGEGREKFGHALLFDTGSSCGEIIGQTKTINSVSIRPCRPYRAATASDDFTVSFYTGTPYKFSKTLKDHRRFVQCVRYAPDGSVFATCGSDGKIFLYNGETGDLEAELVDAKVGSSAHSSGILSLCWSPDSKLLFSSSMDQLTKCWDISSRSVIFESAVKFSNDSPQDNQIVSNIWTGMGLFVLSLSGSYALIDSDTGDLKQIFTGHQKGISALTITPNQNVISASYDGSVCSLNDKLKATSLALVQKLKPSNRIDDLICLDDGSVLASATLDSHGYRFGPQFEVCSWLNGAKMAKVLNMVAFLKDNSLFLFQDSNKVSEFSSFSATPLTLASHENIFAVGLKDKSVVIFKVESNNFIKLHELSANFGAVSALAFNQDGSKLAAGDEQRRVKIYDVATGEPAKSNWCYHNAKVSCLTWLPEDILVSGSLDNSLMVWSLKSPIKPLLTIPNAHTGPITGLASFADGRFVSASQDGSIKIWNLE